jgi:hypothetical protein
MVALAILVSFLLILAMCGAMIILDRIFPEVNNGVATPELGETRPGLYATDLQSSGGLQERRVSDLWSLHRKERHKQEALATGGHSLDVDEARGDNGVLPPSNKGAARKS